jgi:hypothetical protein
MLAKIDRFVRRHVLARPMPEDRGILVLHDPDLITWSGSYTYWGKRME